MVVRMRETRLLVKGPHDMDALHAGREYDLPANFAAYLIMEGKADFRPGRLKKFAPKEFTAPVKSKRMTAKEIIKTLTKLDD